MTIAALRTLCSRIAWCEPAVLESALELALEIAREGREGRRIGTLFTVGSCWTATTPQLSIGAAGAVEAQRLGAATRSLSEVGEES